MPPKTPTSRTPEHQPSPPIIDTQPSHLITLTNLLVEGPPEESITPEEFYGAILTGTHQNINKIMQEASQVAQYLFPDSQAQPRDAIAYKTIALMILNAEGNDLQGEPPEALANPKELIAQYIQTVLVEVIENPPEEVQMALDGVRQALQIKANQIEQQLANLRKGLRQSTQAALRKAIKSLELYQQITDEQRESVTRILTSLTDIQKTLESLTNITEDGEAATTSKEPQVNQDTIASLNEQEQQIGEQLELFQEENLFYTIAKLLEMQALQQAPGENEISPDDNRYLTLLQIENIPITQLLNAIKQELVARFENLGIPGKLVELYILSNPNVFNLVTKPKEIPHAQAMTLQAATIHTDAQPTISPEQEDPDNLKKASRLDSLTEWLGTKEEVVAKYKGMLEKQLKQSLDLIRAAGGTEAILTKERGKYRISIDHIREIFRLNQLAEYGLLSMGRFTLLVTLLEIATIRSLLKGGLSINDLSLEVLPLDVLVPPLQRALEELLKETVKEAEEQGINIQKQERHLPQENVSIIDLTPYRDKELSVPLLPRGLAELPSFLQEFRDEGSEITPNRVPTFSEIEQIVTEIKGKYPKFDLAEFPQIYSQILDAILSGRLNTNQGLPELQTILDRLNTRNSTLLLQLLASPIPYIQARKEGQSSVVGDADLIRALTQKEFTELGQDAQAFLLPLIQTLAFRNIVKLVNESTTSIKGIKHSLSQLELQTEEKQKLLLALTLTLVLINIKSLLIYRLQQTGIKFEEYIPEDQEIIIRPYIKQSGENSDSILLGEPVRIKIEDLQKLTEGQPVILIGAHGSGKSATLQVLASILTAIGKDAKAQVVPELNHEEVDFLDFTESPILIDEAAQNADALRQTLERYEQTAPEYRKPLVLVINTQIPEEIKELLRELSPNVLFVERRLPQDAQSVRQIWIHPLDPNRSAINTWDLEDLFNNIEYLLKFKS